MDREELKQYFDDKYSGKNTTSASDIDAFENKFSSYENDLINKELELQGYSSKVPASDMLSIDEITKKKQDRLSAKVSDLSNDDSNFMLKAKSAYNTVNNLWDGKDLKANYMGKEHSMSNKIFEDSGATMQESEARRQELIDEYNSAEDDPNAKHKVYQLRLQDGIDENGNPIYTYKTGIAETSAAERYKNQYIKGGYEILSEKGFAGAEEWENKWHGLKSNIADRTYDEGYNSSGKKIKDISQIGEGYSEVYNTQNFGFEATPESIAENKARSQQLSDDAFTRRLNGYGKGSDSIIDALQAGAVKTVVDFGDTVLDVLTPGDNTLLNEAKEQASIDKFVGYNRKSADKAIGEATGYFKQGKYANALWEVFKEPQMVAESIPMMLEMTLGVGKFTKTGKLLDDLNKYKQAGNVEKIKELSTQYANEVTDSGKALYRVANNAGFLAAVSQQTNNDLDGRIKNNEDGSGASVPESLSVFASNFALLGLDRIAFNKITGIEGGKKALSDAFEFSDITQKGKILSGIAEKASGLAGAGMAEAAQEYVQTWGEILNQQLGTDKNDGDFSKIISSQENIDNAIGGMLAGSAGGIHMRQASDLVEAGYNKVSGVDLLKDTNEKVQYSFTPDLQYTTRPGSEKLSKDEMALEGEMVVRNIKDYSTKALADSMLGGKPIMDARGNVIDYNAGINGLIETLRHENLTDNKYVNRMLEDRQKRIEAIEDESTRAEEFAKFEDYKNTSLMQNREGYIQDFLSVYESTKKAINTNKKAGTSEQRLAAIASVSQSFLDKINSEPDEFIKTALLSEFTNEAVNDVANNTIYKNKDAKTFGSLGDVSKSVLYGEAGKQYLDGLKQVKQMIFGSLPGDIPNGPRDEFDEKLNQFEEQYNAYNDRLKEEKAKGTEDYLNLLDVKTSEEVAREILDGSGFITNLMKPQKFSINGHMRNITRNLGKIESKNINSIAKQTKNINALLAPFEDLIKFSDSRSKNNEVYSDILENYKSGTRSKEEIAKALFEQGIEFDKTRDDIKKSTLDNIVLQIKKMREAGIPVYRLEKDYKKKDGIQQTGTRMQAEGKAFIDNLTQARKILQGKIDEQKFALEQAIKNKKTFGGLSKSSKAEIEENISRMELLAGTLDSSIAMQVQNNQLLADARIMLNDAAISTGLSREYANLNSIKDQADTDENIASNPNYKADESDINMDEEIESEFEIAEGSEPIKKTGTATTTIEETNTTDGEQDGEQNGTTENNETTEQGIEKEKDEDQEVGSGEIETRKGTGSGSSIIRQNEETEDEIGGTTTEGNEGLASGTKKPKAKKVKTKPEVPEIDVNSMNEDQKIEHFKEELKNLNRNEMASEKLEKVLEDKIKNAEIIIANLAKVEDTISRLNDSISLKEEKLRLTKSDLSKTIDEDKKLKLKDTISNFNIKQAEDKKYLIESKRLAEKFYNESQKTTSDIKNIKAKIEKLKEFSNKKLNAKQRFMIVKEINKAEIDKHKITWKDSYVHEKYVAFKNAELEVEILKVQSIDGNLNLAVDDKIVDYKKEINKAKYAVKTAKRIYDNELFIDKSIRTSAIKTLKEDREKRLERLSVIKSENVKKLTRDYGIVLEIEKRISELENNTVFNLFDVYGKKETAYSYNNAEGKKVDIVLIRSTDIEDHFKYYYGLDDARQGIVQLSKKDNTYKNLVKNSKDDINKVLKNYYDMKGESYKKRIDKEYGETGAKREAFDDQIKANLNYIVNSTFSNANDYLKNATKNLTEDDIRKIEEKSKKELLAGTEGEVEIDTKTETRIEPEGKVKVENKDNVEFEIDQGNIVGIDSNVVIDKNEFSLNLLSLLLGSKTVNPYSKDENVTATLPAYFTDIVRFEAIKEISNMYKILRTDPNNDTETFDDLWQINTYSDDAAFERMNVYENYLSKGIIPKSVVVRGLGRKIYNQLPIKFDKDLVERYTEETIISQIGLYTISQYEKSGLSIPVGDVEHVIKEPRDEKGDKIVINVGVGRENLDAIQVPMDIYAANQLIGLSETLDYLNPSKDRKKPSFSPITSVPVTIKHKKTKLSDTAKEAITTYQSFPYRFQDNVVDIYDLWKDEATRKYAYMQVGIYAPNIENMTNAEIEKTVTKNRNERLEFDILMRFYEEAGTDRDFYLPWDFVTSGRYMISSDVNYQSSKITRFLIGSKGTRTDVTITSKDGKATISDKHLAGIKRSLAQALDYGLDKDLDTFVIREMEKDIILNQKDGNLTIEFGDTIKGGVIKTAFEIMKKNIISGTEGKSIEAIAEESKAIERLTLKSSSNKDVDPEFEGFHAVQTIRELAKLSVALDKAISTSLIDGAKDVVFENTIETNFVIEADGITSGMMITLAQIMSDNAINLLEKGGIYTPEAIEFWNKVIKEFVDKKLLTEEDLVDLKQEDSSDYKITHGLLNRISKIVSSKDEDVQEKVNLIFNDNSGLDKDRAEFQDFYTTISSSVNKRLADVKTSIEANIKSKESYGEKLDDAVKIKNNKQKIKEHKAALSLIELVGNEIKRNMAKDPVMVFIYGSSIESIKNKILQNMIKEVLDKKILEASTPDKDGKFKEMNEDLKNAIELLGFEEFEGEKGISYVVPAYAKITSFSVDENTGDIVENFNENKATYKEYKNRADINDNAIVGKVVPLSELKNVVIDGNMLRGLKTSSDLAYGNTFEDAFEENFSFINDYRDSIKALEVVRFEIFDFKFKEKVEALIADKSSEGFEYNPTNSELDSILQELINEGYGHVIRDINGGHHSFEKSELESSRNRAGLTVLKKDDNSKRYEADVSTSGIDVRKEVVNIGAAPVTSIHNQDGWNIRYATLKDGIMNLFDATVTGLDNRGEVDAKYNEGFSKANTKHSILQSQLVDLEKVLDKLGREGMTKLIDGISKESADKIFEVFEKMTKPLVKEMVIRDNSNAKNDSYKMFIASEALSRHDILKEFNSKIKGSVNSTLKSLNTKHKDIVFAHLYATDTDEQFSGTLGGVRDLKVDTNLIFNFYNDIIYKSFSFQNIELPAENSTKNGFDYIVSNPLAADDKGNISPEAEKIRKEIDLEISKLLNGTDGIKLNQDQKNKINEIIQNLMDCRP